MSSTFGSHFKLTSFGESHGKGVGAVVDGCPAGIALTEADIQTQLDRRRPGQSDLVSPRQEADQVSILSGLEDGQTLGTPIGLLVANRDQRPGDYRELRQIPRPSHADYTYFRKYGLAARSGGGRASARETVARVAAGAVAEMYLRVTFGVEIVAWVQTVGSVACPLQDPLTIQRQAVDRSVVRCPDDTAAAAMIALVEEVRDAADSIGGVINVVCRHVPAGWGEPVFDKLEAKLAQAMLSIPATKGFEVGSGFAAAGKRGSEHNDRFIGKGESLGTVSNHSGGIQGGISNGEPILCQVAFKPPATIGLPQKTADFKGQIQELRGRGRHDPCVVPRAVPIVESMAALVLADMALRQRANER
ncbi:MAG: chorismate synthase [bacterium]